MFNIKSFGGGYRVHHGSVRMFRSAGRKAGRKSIQGTKRSHQKLWSALAKL